MGIKFRCPKGHKLNVKSYLAGKKGFCPKCNTNVDIPLTSQRRGKAEREAEKEANEALQELLESPSETTTGATATVRAARVTAVSTNSENGADDQIKTAKTMPVATRIPTPDSAPPDTPTAKLPQAPGVTPPDPIAEDPNLVWYVRPPFGDKFGPANGELLMDWIKEGRVSPDCLVWQQGWDDWKLASDTFPQMACPPAPPTDHADPLADSVAEPANLAFTQPSSPGTSAATNTSARRLGKQRSSNNSTLMLVSFLSVALVILLIVLFFVLK